MQLHEHTQRFILLSIFYLLGPMLTLGIIGGIVLRKLPSNARYWERSLFQQTGILWTIQLVEYRSPGCIRLHNVKICGDISERPIFHAKQIDVRLVSETGREKIFPGIKTISERKTTGLTSWFTNSFPSLHSSDKYWQITAPVSVVDFREYSSDESARLIQNILRKIGTRLDIFSEVPIQFVFDEVAVVSEYSLKKPGDKLEDKIDFFRFIQGNVYQTPEKIQSDWSFQIKDVSETDREYLSFSFSDALTVAFRTGKQPISCDFAAVFCGMFKHFFGGSFQGEFILSSQIGTNAQTVRLNQAVFKNIPLAPLIRSYTDFAATGTITDLQFHQAEFSTETKYAEGNLLVEGGSIAKSLLHRCVDKFQLTVEPESTLYSPMQMIPFEACAIHFRLQPQGIDFWADTKWRNAFMHHRGDARFPLWSVYFPTQRRTVTYHELMSVFAPDSAPVVPLTQGTQALLPHIPIK